jgi:membrane protein DedA with SNARE-associated domain/membrane-associated phospholipid phosphatase
LVLQALIDTLAQYPVLTLGVVFAAALLEAVAVVGTVVPGSTVVFAAGMLVGLQVLNPWRTGLAAVMGAITGDGFSYWLGRRYHAHLRTMWPLKAYPALYERGRVYFAQNDGKSVFLARFLGPLRAIVPVIAGMSDMPLAKFTAVNVLSAVAWAAAHLLPGVLFGASLQLAGAVSSRLVILVVGIAAAAWVCIVLLRLLHGRLWPIVIGQRDRIVAWARTGSGVFSRAMLSLLDPERPESFGLLLAAVLLLGGGWLFLGILEDVVSNDPLVQIDHVVFTALQALRTGWAEQVAIMLTELGSATVALTVIGAVSVLLAIKRCWRTLAYWLVAVGFSQALVWMLKLTLGRARPMAMYDGADRFSFPSGHAASSIVLYGFLGVLLARGKSPRTRWAITLAAAVLIALISFSRLYLGAHWLSDVLASLSLGTAWVALLSIVYLLHVQDERLPARGLSLTALGALVLAGAVMISTQRAADVARYAPAPAPAAIVLSDWQAEGWRRLPAWRSDVGGDADEPLSVQWVGTADGIERVLQASGWHRPPPWASRATMLWLLPTTAAAQLPVLTKLQQGEVPALTLAKPLDPTQRLVLRLWVTTFRVATAIAPEQPLWIGTATLERLSRPAGILTIARTDQDFKAASAQFAQDLRATGVSLAVRRRDLREVLLIQ